MLLTAETRGLALTAEGQSLNTVDKLSKAVGQIMNRDGQLLKVQKMTDEILINELFQANPKPEEQAREEQSKELTKEEQAKDDRQEGAHQGGVAKPSPSTAAACDSATCSNL